MSEMRISMSISEHPKIPTNEEEFFDFGSKGFDE